MFDLRYHVASLAAVFLALVIGILASGSGCRTRVDNAKTGLLERQVASLQKQLDQQVQQTGTVAREQTRPAASSTRRTPRSSAKKRGKHVAVVYVGSPNGAMRDAVNRTLINADGQQLRLRVMKVPINTQQNRQMPRRTPRGRQVHRPGPPRGAGGAPAPSWCSEAGRRSGTSSPTRWSGSRAEDRGPRRWGDRRSHRGTQRDGTSRFWGSTRVSPPPESRRSGSRASDSRPTASDLHAGRALVGGRPRHRRRAARAGGRARRGSVRAVRGEAVHG